MSNTATVAEPAAMDALRTRQKATWAAGDYARIGVTLQIVGETLGEAINLKPGSRVLDVAAGNGNATLAAARRFCDVTSTDYVPALLAAGEARAQAEGQSVRFVEAAAESLPFDDSSFDYALSTFGVMFAADHPRAAAEMLRVVRPGGKIGLANWTPQGFIGQLFKVITGHVAPPPAAQSPLRWGTEGGLRQLFGAGATDIESRPRHYAFRYRDAGHFVAVFRTWYGPVLRAFEALPAERRPALEADLLALVAQWNQSGDETVMIPAEYLEVVVTRA